MRNAALIALSLLLCLPLAAEQMNVKELTGLSDFELVRAMQEMSASLGVNCDFCHARKGNDLDFTSDEKHEKKTAREMIAMTKAANASTFNGHATVSCYTCHRGKESPTGLVPLPVEPPAPAAAEAKEAGEKPVLPSVEDIVKKYAAAIGDSERWASLQAKGTRESLDGKQTAPFEMQVSHGKFHAVSESPRGKMEQVVSGDEGWMKGGPEPRPMNANDLARFRYQAGAFAPVEPKEINTDPKGSRVIRKEKLGEKETWLLFSVIDSKSRQRLYFDTTTGLLVRRIVLNESPVGTIPSQTDYDDWKDAGGTKYPFVVKWSSPDARNSAVRKYSEVAAGAKIDEKVFAK